MRAAYVALITVAVALISGCGRRPAPDKKAETPPAGGPRKLALLIGIDNYQSSAIPTLRGCRNDIRAMKNVLIGKYGFDSRGIRVLSDAQATYDGILKAFREHLLAQAVNKDDIVVIHYSGHGSQQSSSATSSGSNESIVPYDSRNPKNLDISADAFSSMIAQLAGQTKNITVILDSCNSGRIVGVTRSQYSVVGVRGIDRAADPPPPSPYPAAVKRSLKPGASGFSPLDDSFVLLAAALASEYANEYQDGSETFGAMSYFLVRELQHATSESTYDDIMRSVRLRVEERVQPKQSPQLVGTNADKHLFSNDRSIVEPSVDVVTRGQNVELPFTGRVHGVVPGAKFDVYGPQTHNFEPSVPRLGRIVLTTVNAFDSEARVTDGGPLPEIARAVFRDRGTGAPPLRIWIERTGALDPLRKAAGTVSEIQLTPDRLTANLLIRFVNGMVSLQAPDGFELSSAAPETAGPGAAADLQRWAHWFDMLAIENPGSGLRVRMELSRTPTNRAAGNLPQISAPDMTFRVKDPLQVTVFNDSDANVYVTLLALSSDRSINVVFPRSADKGTAFEIKGHSSRPLPQISAVLPDCVKQSRDILMLFASTQPVSLLDYEQAGFCDSNRGWKVESGIATRGWTTDPGLWTTVRRVVEVRH